MSSAEAPAIVWFRQDLRLADNPALAAAVKSKRPLILLYLLDDDTPGPWRIGGASRWWLHHSLAALAADLEKRGAALVLRRGPARTAIPALVKQTKAAAIYWNRCYEPFAIARDKALKETLSSVGVEAHSFNGALLMEPWALKTKTGEPYKVFTPFWRAALQSGAFRSPIAAPKRFNGYRAPIRADALDDWALPPSRPNWAKGFAPLWRPGEAGAHAALSAFLDERLSSYAAGRDMMGARATSQLSPHLHFGEISPAQIYAATETIAHDQPQLSSAAAKFLSEIGWREFSHNLLFHWPTLPEKNWRVQFDGFPWREDEAGFAAWRKGQTGYPIVDAGMRELWATGTVHNRARMITASFLIKHLLIDWRRGAAWFWDTLLDADLANNSASWQWVAGSGADAAPYFRIFNPVTQGERYDADGAYVRRWVPELAQLPDKFIHRPWEAARAPADYPAPIVEHAAARQRALAAFASLSG
ncbi:MAG TPA: deoxyribodipyrimidine photo-lyase [Terricaulis sp.]|nr:deoxyribodipyrimidine photo-lyase [Terricaulis sp.]